MSSTGSVTIHVQLQFSQTIANPILVGICSMAVFKRHLHECNPGVSSFHVFRFSSLVE